MFQAVRIPSASIWGQPKNLFHSSMISLLWCLDGGEREEVMKNANIKLEITFKSVKS
jgi:hypothetical protein